MRIQWHCRGCNETGVKDLDLQELIKNRTSEDLLTLCLSKIEHSCEHPKLGIRVGD